MHAVKTILIDFHGVLTDGRQSISASGEYMFDHVHYKDSRAIRQLLAEGYDVVIVTASDNDIIKRYAERLGCGVHVARDKSKIPFENYIAIGDDAWDISMMKNAVKAYCPSDADNSCRGHAEFLKTKGGHGVIAELLYILK